MNRRRVTPLFTALVLGGLVFCLAACSLLPSRHKKNPADQEEASYGGRKPSGHGLAVELKSAPDPLKLGETKQLNVTFILRNVTKKIVTLKFPTTQIFEILLREPNSEKVVGQWSTEHSFTADSRLLIINPGERLEYSETIGTGELKAGNAYTLEAYIVGYEKDLRVTKAILPQP